MSTLVDLADEIVELLNGHTFSWGFTAVRAYYLPTDLEDTTLRVFVKPGGILTNIASKKNNEDLMQVSIHLVKTVEEEEVDGLMSLVEEIRLFLEDKQFSEQNIYLRGPIENDPAYDTDRLLNNSQFDSIILLTYGMIREEGNNE